MSSLRRIDSSRANAASSRGPINPERKERSSAYAIRHGLLAKCVVLENESRECFDDLVTQHTERFAPADGVEFGMIEEMAAAYWRLRRAWAIEKRLMEKALRNQPPGDEAARIAALSELAASPELNLLHRYQARLHRIYQRALDNLVMLGELELPNEANPISEQSAPVAHVPGGDAREVDIPTPRIETGPLDAPIAPEGGGDGAVPAFRASYAILNQLEAEANHGLLPAQTQPGDASCEKSSGCVSQFRATAATH